jgi:hypothetical protein
MNEFSLLGDLPGAGRLSRQADRLLSAIVVTRLSIPLRWLISAPSPEKIERALESSRPNVREEARALLAAGAGSAD